MHRFTLLLIILFIINDLSAQQLPIFTQYRENHSLLNPATIPSNFIQSDGYLTSEVGISYRYQWMGLQDAPRTFTARYDRVVDDYNFTIGGTLLSDQTGPTGVNGGLLRYSYQLAATNNLTVSVGLAGGVLQYAFRGSEGIVRDVGDEIGEMNFNRTQGEVQLGIFFINEIGRADKLYGGLSVPQLLNFTISSSTAENMPWDREPHYYATLGWIKNINGYGTNDLFIEPTLWLKYVPNAPLQLDANFRFQMVELFWLGTGYSMSMGEAFSSNNVHLEAGFIIGELAGLDGKNLKIGYGYGRGINTYGPRFGNTHEINLTYSWE
ncbi:MAG: type IX secretion system membrane protein PorP/SprF [Saprospiraceae bacterium]